MPGKLQQILKASRSANPSQQFGYSVDILKILESHDAQHQINMVIKEEDIVQLWNFAKHCKKPIRQMIELRHYEILVSPRGKDDVDGREQIF